MQAVILAAGRGTRMGKLTEGTPKPLLQVAGKTLLEYELDVLPESVDEIIIVVGYKGSAIQQYIGGFYKEKRILYIEQEELDGTAGALWRVKDVLKDKFIVLMADDLYDAKDIERCARGENWILFVEHLDHMQQGGNVTVDANGNVLDIVEGMSHAGKPGLIGTNMFLLDTRLFDYQKVLKAPDSQEYGLPQTVLAASKQGNIPFHVVKSKSWFQITRPEDLQKAEEMLKK
jgi:NDP-sugar pyrophosphorylase family protein